MFYILNVSLISSTVIEFIFSDSQIHCYNQLNVKHVDVVLFHSSFAFPQMPLEK